jgi:hypothetical protein
MPGEAARRSRDDLRRLVFWRRVLVEGGRWLYSVLGLVLFVVSVLALLGIVFVLERAPRRLSVALLVHDPVAPTPAPQAMMVSPVMLSDRAYGNPGPQRRSRLR